MFKISKYTIDKKSKPLIIAEVGQAHDGSLGIAHSYIDAVADAGASAIKFQTHYANEESTPKVLKIMMYMQLKKSFYS